MDIPSANALIPSLIGAITAIGGAFITVQKIVKGIKKEREEEAAKILQSAKEDISQAKIELQAEIDKFQLELANLEKNIYKDMEHIRDTYNGEIRNLGEKIENLREELRSQHAGIVGLLSKLIDNRD